MSIVKRKLLTVAGAASLATLGAAVAWGAATPPGAVDPPPAPVSASGAPLSFAPIVQKVAPAVVSVDITGRVGPSEAALRAPGGEDGPLGPGGIFGDGAAPYQAAPRKFSAAGSGFFISADGYVLTNAHVVDNAEKISVHMADGKVLTARLVGRDPATDIAVLKVDGGPFPFVSFEDSAKPRVGDWVVAVGNPFGLGGTATAGIVSALGREDVADSPLIDYMQIDAPINRGNSGGPTFDTDGRVVGVNTAIFSPSGGSIGIGFDIPAGVARDISRQLILEGHVSHGYLGTTIQPITPDLASSLGLGSVNGAIVDSLTPGGSAARAGIEAGDVILAVNGKSVDTPAQLTRAIAFAKPGERLDLTVRRDGRSRQIVAQAGVRPSERALARALTPRDRGEDEDDGG